MRYVVDTETLGLDPFSDAIIAIGIMDEKGNYFSNGIKNVDDERELLKWFWETIKDATSLIGFNIEYDWKMLKLRSLRHRVKIRHLKKYDQRIDVRYLLTEDKFAKGKLKDFAEFFGFDLVDDIPGSEVPAAFADGKFNEIAHHLASDVRLTWNIYNLLVQYA